MNQIKVIAVITAMLSLLSIRSLGQQREIRYSELVHQLTDLKALAALPEVGEKSAMWSSYDRDSKVDPETGEFIDWAANIDGLRPQYIRKEGDKEVLAEMKGPGAIVRIWSASPGKGHVQVYIDGKETPIIDLPFIEYFKNNSIAAFQYSELVYETDAGGYNNYVPISYQKSCKVVADPGWGQYYQFNYITFPEGTTLETFQATPNPTNANALADVAQFFKKDLGQLPYTVAPAEEKNVTLHIPAGGSKSLTIKGAKAIYALKAHLNWKDQKRMNEAMRKLILQINWDGEASPSVWSPLGDFFGSAPGYNAYTTLPMGMLDGKMYSYWYMPFEDSAVITLVNHFEEPLVLDLSIGLEALKGHAADYGRFHAKWHRNILPLEDTARWPDWTVLETEGRGRFLGMSLLVWNPKGGSCREFGGSGYWWWGEGDEKFFVDGETFPSTFGTGTEDYFGYAWCRPDYFSRPFHSQNYTEGNMGYQSMNRWQVIDNVPFQKSFKGYMEKYFPDKWPTQYATTVYWYLDKNGNDPIGATPPHAIYGYENPIVVYREPGVIEGENMQIVKNTGGYATTDSYASEKLFSDVSGHKVLLWEGNPKEERTLTVSFQNDKSGKYKLSAHVIKSPAGGVFRISLNGQDLLGAFNLMANEKPGKTETIVLGIVQLDEGKQTIQLERLSENGAGGRLELDYLRLRPL